MPTGEDDHTCAGESAPSACAGKVNDRLRRSRRSRTVLHCMEPWKRLCQLLRTVRRFEVDFQRREAAALTS